jgi:hypothetical protein
MPGELGFGAAWWGRRLIELDGGYTNLAADKCTGTVAWRPGARTRSDQRWRSAGGRRRARRSGARAPRRGDGDLGPSAEQEDQGMERTDVRMN